VRQNSGGGEYLLVSAENSGSGGEIVLTRQDISEIQFAKAAIRAGIEILLEVGGVGTHRLWKNLSLPERLAAIWMCRARCASGYFPKFLLLNSARLAMRGNWREANAYFRLSASPGRVACQTDRICRTGHPSAFSGQVCAESILLRPLPSRFPLETRIPASTRTKSGLVPPATSNEGRPCVRKFLCRLGDSSGVVLYFATPPIISGQLPLFIP